MFQNLMARIINGFSIIGIGALCVASLGVANMVIASVHARRYELGVLRAIGAGRWQLVRLVLAEVTLIGFIAGILGAAAGLSFAFMATQVDRVLIGFATSFMDSDLTAAVAYASLLVVAAVVITTLFAWAASLGPALRGVTAAQRSILAEGRG
jgi:putative ABC transport system permease protein